ncbi:hypothetical protein ACISK3_01340 [Morganella morganii]|nr:hypothetical protein [Morganella morganii]
MPEYRYVVGGNDGWLTVLREPSKARVSLPTTLKVELTSNKDDRDYFKVLEGPEAGGSFSVKERNLAKSAPAYLSGAVLQFSISKKILEYNAVKISAFTHTSNPVPAGNHPIQIPDFPHSLGSGYMSESKYAKNWFYLGTGNAVAHNNDRYLHPGAISAGCVTVDVASWTALYEYLIRCRSGNGKDVGRIIVTN